MGVTEIIIAVVAAAVVLGVMIAAVIRKAKGKTGCSGCSECSCCPHSSACKAKALAEKKRASSANK